MPIYEVDIEQLLERRVTVEAANAKQAKGMAERGENAWLDATKATSLNITAGEVNQVSDLEPDAMSAYKERIER
jgi:hypothetical protein